MERRAYKKIFIMGFTLMLVFYFSEAAILAKAQKVGVTSKTKSTTNRVKKRDMKGSLAKPLPFQVKNVKFKEIKYAGTTRLAFTVTFNNSVDPVTVKQNSNIRLLKIDNNHFWRDASTQGNIVRVTSHTIAWLSGAALETGVYIVHLRGTIKNKYGTYLDCDGDGKGEGGKLPAFESKMYQAHVQSLIPIDPEEVDRNLRQ